MYIFAPFMMIFARAWADRNKKTFTRGVAIVLGAAPVLWVCAAPAAALLGPFFLKVMYGESILAYTGLLQPAVIAAIANLVVSVLCYLLSIMRGTKGLIIGNLAGIAAAVAVSVPLLNTMGVAGAAWATVVSRAVQAGVCFAALARQSKAHFAA